MFYYLQSRYPFYKFFVEHPVLKVTSYYLDLTRSLCSPLSTPQASCLPVRPPSSVQAVTLRL